jgi:hypothetical protein
MIADWTVTESDLTLFLCKGSATGQSLSNLNVRIVNQIDSSVDLSGDAHVWNNGGQAIQLSFAVSGTGLARPGLKELGSLRLLAPDGSWTLLSPALITSRRRTTLAGAAETVEYNIVASVALRNSSDFAGIFVTDSRGFFKTNSNGIFAIRPFD